VQWGLQRRTVGMTFARRSVVCALIRRNLTIAAS
jgi:hypothetical protein